MKDIIGNSAAESRALLYVGITHAGTMIGIRALGPRPVSGIRMARAFPLV